MDCNTCRTLIGSFLNNTLDEKNKRDVLEHIKTCSNCNQDMKLHYFVDEGLRRLENGGNLNLEAEYNHMILEEEFREEIILRNSKIVRWIFAGGLTFTLFVLIRSIFLV